MSILPVSYTHLSANPSWAPYIALTTGSAGLIQTFGDEDLKKTFLPKMFSGEWSGTMCLTEPSAGSDVGDILTKACLLYTSMRAWADAAASTETETGEVFWSTTRGGLSQSCLLYTSRCV